MLSAEERRQRILANKENRLAKLRQVTESERPADAPPMAPIAEPAPIALIQKSPGSTPVSAPVAPVREQAASSLFSTISSTASMFSSIASSIKGKPVVENTKELLIVDQQHLFVFVLGLVISVLYSFYISPDSNLFFHVFFTCCLCILTSRYAHMQMKHRTNPLISTLMLSGFRPTLVKRFVLVYTLVCDAWILFAFYFVAFCLTHACFSLFFTQ